MDALVLLLLMLEQYIQRWFDDLTKCCRVEDTIDKNRLFMNITCRIALRTYMIQLSTEKIFSIIQTATGDFLNEMFVMTEKDINGIAKEQNECFGIVIPDNMLHQYIKRWFNHLTKTNLLKKFLNKSRPLMNVTFLSTVRTYMKQLNNEKIASLIEDVNSDFLNIIFVMTEDEIKDNAENRYEYLGIVIHKELLLQYIIRWMSLTLSIAYSVMD